MKNRNMKNVFKDLEKNYNFEEILALKTLIDEYANNKLDEFNSICNRSNVAYVNQVTPIVPEVSVAPVIETPVAKVTHKEAVEKFTEEIRKEETVVDNTSSPKIKEWDGKGMTVINKFNKNTRKYEEFSTTKEGVLYCTVSNYDPSVLGGQLGHNGKIYNFIFSTKFELPVVLGSVSVEYLKSIKDKILAKAPETFVEAEKLGTKYMNEYGYGGRFFYDELEKGNFIFKTKDGYKGFTQGMSFRIAIDEDTDEERIYTLKNGFFFSQNYENAKADRQMRLYPNLVEDIKTLVTKVDDRFINYEEGVDYTNSVNVTDDIDYNNLVDDDIVETKTETTVKVEANDSVAKRAARMAKLMGKNL